MSDQGLFDQAADWLYMLVHPGATSDQHPHKDGMTHDPRDPEGTVYLDHKGHPMRYQEYRDMRNPVEPSMFQPGDVLGPELAALGKGAVGLAERGIGKAALKELSNHVGMADFLPEGVTEATMSQAQRVEAIDKLGKFYKAGQKPAGTYDLKGSAQYIAELKAKHFAQKRLEENLGKASESAVGEFKAGGGVLEKTNAGAK